MSMQTPGPPRPHPQRAPLATTATRPAAAAAPMTEAQARREEHARMVADARAKVAAQHDRLGVLRVEKIVSWRNTPKFIDDARTRPAIRLLDQGFKRVLTNRSVWLEFEVKWKNYGEEENTYETLDNIIDDPYGIQLVLDFLRREFDKECPVFARRQDWDAWELRRWDGGGKEERWQEIKTEALTHLRAMRQPGMAEQRAEKHRKETAELRKKELKRLLRDNAKAKRDAERRERQKEKKRKAEKAAAARSARREEAREAENGLVKMQKRAERGQETSRERAEKPQARRDEKSEKERTKNLKRRSEEWDDAISCCSAGWSSREEEDERLLRQQQMSDHDAEVGQREVKQEPMDDDECIQQQPIEQIKEEMDDEWLDMEEGRGELYIKEEEPDVQEIKQEPPENDEWEAERLRREEEEKEWTEFIRLHGSKIKRLENLTNIIPHHVQFTDNEEDEVNIAGRLTPEFRQKIERDDFIHFSIFPVSVRANAVSGVPEIWLAAAPACAYYDVYDDYMTILPAE